MQIEKKNILPIQTPSILSYPEQAYVTAIIQNSSNANKWILDNFLQLWYVETKYGIYVSFHPHPIYDICPFIERNYVGNDIKNLLDFVIDSINNKCYLVMWLDQYYIEESANFNQKHLDHPTLIYGYDLTEYKFYMADFYKNDGYTVVQENINNVLDSYNGVKKYIKGYTNDITKRVIQIKLNKNINYDLSISNISNKLSFFMQGKMDPNVIDETVKYLEVLDCAWGINVCDKIMGYMERVKVENIKKVEMRNLFILKDFYRLFLERVEYLVKYKGLEKSNIKICKDVYKITELIVILLLMYNYSNNTAIIDKILYNLGIISKWQKNTLPKIIEGISKLQ